MMFDDADEITYNVLTQLRILLALLNYCDDTKYLFDQKYQNISNFRNFIEYLVKYSTNSSGTSDMQGSCLNSYFSAKVQSWSQLEESTNH